MILLNLIFAQNSHALTLKSCQVKFTSKGKPVLVTIEGHSESPCKGVFGSAKDGSGTFSMNLDKLETGIALRNKHLRENYLHVDKFPVATLTVSSLKDFQSIVIQKKNGKSFFQGELELHGNKKPITDGEYDFDGKKMKAMFSILLPDFGIEQPAFMGIAIYDRIFISVELEIDGI
jgi:polyisoprenoid-binding protein YceI